MADRNAGRPIVKKKEKKSENKTDKEKEKEKEEKDKGVKKPDKTAKKSEKSEEQPQTQEEKKKEGDGGAGAGEGAEGKMDGVEENGEFQPIDLPPFEIVTGEQMNPFYFKFQFRNVEYSSGRNKTFLCFRVETPGGSVEPLQGFMEDEHALAHAEEAFFQQVLPHYDPNQCYEVTWYVTSSPCAACATKLADILRQRKKLRLTILCSRLFMWEEPEIGEGLKALVGVGCKLRMMKPTDFLKVWDTYVEKEEQIFAPWEDCQDNYVYYEEKLAEILK
ncbi:C-_U-editing enzyme APOBEC-2b [Osmerus mordax]|uniref:C->U-editing enzyme APOBEC-2b n=1 Tax=Osmerus mordax TaxID=8014 RepID=UPI00350F4E8E